MNINPIVISALSSLSLPVEPDRYKGTAAEYITFNYSDERPALNADDIDVEDETTIQVHYFTKSDPQTNKKAIRRLLRAGGFSIISTSQFPDIDNPEVTHVIVEAEISGEIND